MKIALKVTPQRTTQYTRMATVLAAPELLASPLATLIQDVAPVLLAGQDYLLVTLDDAILEVPATRTILARLGATSEAYEYFEQIGDMTGPFLRPIEPHFTPFVPLEMMETRRYKGKTNELLTRVLLNVAIFAGNYRDHYTERLRILDPLAGGGTTLFLALAYGYDAFGIERERQDVETTAVFIKQYLESERISYKETDERGRRAGRRYHFEIGPKGQSRSLVLVNGDTTQAEMHVREVIGGPKMHAVVSDLPYGIQHFGELTSLLEQALSAWERILLPGGTLALSWNATRVERAELSTFIEQHTNLSVLNIPPYTQFAHAVDRVIKRRDILVARKT